LILETNLSLFQVFYPSVDAKGCGFPVILWTDNHKSHYSLAISRLCKKLKIILIGLAPNSTSFLQPNDQLFGSLKQMFFELLRFKRRDEFDFKLTLENFPLILQEALDAALVKKPQVIRWAYKMTGICPFNPDNIDFSKLKSNAKSEEFSVEEPADDDFIALQDELFVVSEEFPDVEVVIEENEESLDGSIDSEKVRFLI
jgi:hypothetical protein